MILGPTGRLPSTALNRERKKKVRLITLKNKGKGYLIVLELHAVIYAISHKQSIMAQMQVIQHDDSIIHIREDSILKPTCPLMLEGK